MSRALVVLGLVAFAAGCPKSKTGGTDAGRAPECSTRADCDAGLVCTPNFFCDACSSSGQCSVKETCESQSRLCSLKPGWGTQCVANQDCQAGSWCKQGLCLDRSQVSLCPLGTNAECPQGLRCNVSTTVCEEDLGCSTNDDCSGGEVCNVGSRVCVPRCTVETQATVCAAGERCVSERCVQCASNAECGVGLICNTTGQCAAGDRCYTDRDCLVPLSCFVQTGACLPKPPPCISDDDCTSLQRCAVSSGLCVPKACQPDRYEPNNDASKAFNVAPGAYRKLTLCEADVDWFAIALNRGDQLGVNLDADPFSENAYTTVIKDPTGRTVSGGHLLVSYVAPVSAQYDVVISATDAFQSYDVTFLVSRGTPCDDDANEANDDSSHATALNSSTQIEGAICPQDQDWFRATVPPAKGVSATLINYDSSKGLLRVCVLASDGVTALGCSDDLNPQVTVSSSQVNGSTALIRVVGSTDRIANPYTLHVEYP
jgi:hypothetical protein